MTRAEVRRHRSLGVDGGSEVQKEASTLEALTEEVGGAEVAALPAEQGSVGVLDRSPCLPAHTGSNPSSLHLHAVSDTA